MRVLLDSIGCRLNQSEIERFAQQLCLTGHILVGSPQESDLIIINTCSVTAAAAADSRSRARRMWRLNPEARLILTGCWCTLEKEHAKRLPGVIKVIDNSRKEHLVPLLLDMPPRSLDQPQIKRNPLPGARQRTRAFIKAQDGCDNHCTYCVTRLARGPARSMPVQRILSDIQNAVSGGTKEAVLCGVQLSAYGKDLKDGSDLKALVKTILYHTDIARLRFSSLEPWGLPEGFFDLWQDHRLCRQLHLPLQSGSNATLQRMRRPIRSETFASIVQAARERIPDIAITTDIMVGFPGESEAEFHASLDFIEQMEFAHAHIFIYSPRPGTAAERIANPIPSPLCRQRSQIVRDAIQQSAQRFKRNAFGKAFVVLWETAKAQEKGTWQMRGLTDNYLRVNAILAKNLWNQLSSVRILGLRGKELQAELLS